ncbi:MAG: response regulator [Chitinophagaceae bacterium]|nr:response regulator [Rubrivivax sp.]
MNEPMSKPHGILLVEDNPMDVDLTRRAFASRKLANPLEVARDGQEALDIIARWDSGHPVPAVVLLDINLPKVGGLEVLRRLRAHPRFGQVPVVVLTTSAEDRDVQAAYALGANSYIVKPVSFDSFIGVAGQIDAYWLALNIAPRPASP